MLVFYFHFNILSSPLMGFFFRIFLFFMIQKMKFSSHLMKKKMTLIMAQEMFQENGLPAPYVPEVKVHITVCKNNLSVYCSILSSVYTSILLSVYTSILSSVYTSKLLSVYTSILLSVYTSILLSVYTSILLSVYNSILLSVYDSISNESHLISLMMMYHRLKSIHLNIFKVKDTSVCP